MLKNFWKKSIAALLAAALMLSPSAGSIASEILPPLQSPPPDAPSVLSDLLFPQESNRFVPAAAQDLDTAAATPLQLAEAKAKALLSYGAVSVQYAMIDNGKIVMSGQDGFADINTQTKPDKDTMYGIGSVSKMFTATAVMQLVEKGKVKLDEPVNTYVPEFKMADERYKQITVRMLLNHSSGFSGSTMQNSVLLGDNDHIAYENFLKNISSQHLKADPGAFSVYCNDGFTMAEILVERVSGLSFTDYLRTYIASSQMTNTKTPMSSFPRENLAGIYTAGGKTKLPHEALSVIGAGGIYSTAEDLCHFAENFMDNGTGLLSPATLEAMSQKEYLRGIWPEDVASNFNYGLGWDSVNLYPFDQYDMKAWTKGGDTVFYHGSMLVIPEHNIAFSILSAGGSSAYSEVLAQEVLLAYMKEKGIIDEIKEPSLPSLEKGKMPAEYEAYSGLYSSILTPYLITIKDSTLLLESPYDPKVHSQLHYTSDGWFASEPNAYNTVYMKPEKASNGITYLLTKGYSTIPGIGTTFSLQYEAQKQEPHTLSKEVRAAWEKRVGAIYLPINEKYSSISFLSALPVPGFILSDKMEGYMAYYKIEDEDSFSYNLQIPCMMGRDLQDLHLYRKDGVEYLKLNEYIYISAKAIKSLSSAAKSTVKLAASGYSRYYKITPSAAGKKITVKLPEDSAFIVADKNNVITFNSHLEASNTTTLPKEGYVMFNGTPNASFAIELN